MSLKTHMVALLIAGLPLVPPLPVEPVEQTVQEVVGGLNEVVDDTQSTVEQIIGTPPNAVQPNPPPRPAAVPSQPPAPPQPAPQPAPQATVFVPEGTDPGSVATEQATVIEVPRDSIIESELDKQRAELDRQKEIEHNRFIVIISILLSIIASLAFYIYGAVHGKSLERRRIRKRVDELLDGTLEFEETRE